MTEPWQQEVYHPSDDDTPQDWMILREQIIKRDHGRCYACHRKTNLTVHHLVPRSEGGPSNPKNLLTLCTVCHNLIEPYAAKIRSPKAIRRAIKHDLWADMETGLDRLLDPARPLRTNSGIGSWQAVVYGGARPDSILKTMPTTISIFDET